MFNKGLQTDADPLYQEEGSYRHLLGGTIVDPEGPVSQEAGTLLVGTLLEGMLPIGDVDLGDDTALLFLTAPGRSALAVVKRNGVEVVLDDSVNAAGEKLGLSLQYPISATVRRGVRGEAVVYWTDGLNPPRRLDLSRLPQASFAVSDLLLFPEVRSFPNVELKSVSAGGGRLAGGVYSYAVAFVDPDGTRTNWLAVTKPVKIGLGDPYAPNAETLGSPPPVEGGRGRSTGKSVTFEVSNIDPSYTRLRVAVLYWADNGDPERAEDPDVQVLPDVYFASEGTTYGGTGDPRTVTFTHTGNETTTPGDLQEVLIPRVSYRTAKTLAQVDDVLYLAGLEGKGEDVGFQPYANAIRVETVRKEVTQTDLKNPVFLFNNGGFKRDEVYALYLAFVLKDGRLTRAYHIPGRQARGADELGYATGTLTVTAASLTTEGFAEGAVEFEEGFPPGTGPAALQLHFGGAHTTTTPQLPANSDVLSLQNSLFQACLADQWVTDRFIVTDGRSADGTAPAVQFRARLPREDDNYLLTMTLPAGMLPEWVPIRGMQGGRMANQPFAQGFELVAVGPFGEQRVSVQPVPAGEAANDVAERLRAALVSAAGTLWSSINVVRTGPTLLLTATTQTTGFNGTHFSLISGQTGVVLTSTPLEGGGVSATAGEALPLDPGHPYYSELGSLPGIKRFHVEGVPDQTGMAYWENADEVYPESPTSEVWTVDGQGRGSTTGQTLAGQPVRHHHFPEYRFSRNVFTDTAPDPDTTAYHIQGIQLKGLRIPASIRSQIVGYRLFFAERSYGNRTVVDQTFLSPLVNVRTEDWPPPKGAPEQYTASKTFTNRVPGFDEQPDEVYDHTLLASRSFGLLRNQRYLSLRNVAFAKALYSSNGDLYATPHPSATLAQSVEMVRRVTDASYIASNTLETQALGTDILNPGMEEKAVFKLQTAVPEDGVAGYVRSYVWDLHQYARNLYSSFDSQRLVGCGPVVTDLSETSAAIYGGDTVTTPFQTGVQRARPVDRFTPDDDPLAEPVYTPDGFQDVVTPEGGVPTLLWNYHLGLFLWGYSYSGTEKWDYESDFNMHFRHDGELPWQKSAGVGLAKEHNQLDSPVPLVNRFKNWLGFNGAYQIGNVIGTPAPANRAGPETESYPNRVIRSGKAFSGLDLDPFRTFKDADFYDVPRNRGPIVVLRAIGDGLLMHAKKGAFVTRGREDVVLGDARVYLGAGDIFTAPPSEPFQADNGHGGIGSPTAGSVTPLGYVWADRMAGKIFRLTNELEEISSKGNTLLFEKLLRPALAEYGLVGDDLVRPYFLLDVRYDPRLFRAVVVCRDLNPTARFEKEYSEQTLRYQGGSFETQSLASLGGSEYETWTRISFNDARYFTPTLWTATFLMDRGIWEGFQHYHPDWLFPLSSRLFSVEGPRLHVHGDGARGEVYGEPESLAIDLVVNKDPITAKTLRSVWIDSRVIDDEGQDLQETFSSLKVWTEADTSADLVLTPDLDNRTGRVRRTRGIWHVSGLRDTAPPPNNGRLPAWSYIRRIEGKAFLLRLVRAAQRGVAVSLVAAGINSLPEKR